MLSRKHYKAIAEIIQTTYTYQGRDPIYGKQDYRDLLIDELSLYFRRDNPKFEVLKFKAACT